MNRKFILIACAMMLFPGSQAMAGTWSWHSDLIEQMLLVIRDNHNTEERARSVAPMSLDKAALRDRADSGRADRGRADRGRADRGPSSPSTHRSPR